MATSDFASMHGYGMDALSYNGDAWDQNNCTSAVLVDLGLGRQRVADANATMDKTRIIGGNVALQHYDPRLNMYKGDPLLIDTSHWTKETGVEPSAFDGRATVLCSLAGYVPTVDIRSDSDWRRNFRFAGPAGFDTLIENAATGKAPHYGTTVYNSGATGGSAMVHAVPEKIAAGELLVVDIGPLDNDRRAEWSRDFAKRIGPWQLGAHKPVYRPWNPNGGSMQLMDGLAQFLYDTYTSPEVLDRAANPALSSIPGPSVNADRAVGSNMAQATLEIMWMGIVLAMKAGLVDHTDVRAVEKVKDLDDLFKKDFSEDQRATAALIGKRMGLLDRKNGTERDALLITGLMGAAWQSYIEGVDEAETFSMANALIPSAEAQQIQEDSSVRLVTTITGTYHENAGFIALKATHNSVQGMRLQGVVMH